MPKLLTTPFATSGLKNDVPTTTGTSANSATYSKGFPDITMKSSALGGKPPSGKDFNGILYDITDNIVYQTKGGRYKFNSTYATSIGGYPLGAILLLNDGVTDVVSTVANNLTDPNVIMTGWELRQKDSGILSWSGRTQESKNKDQKSILDFGGVEGETCPRLSSKFATLAEAKAAYPTVADKITSLDLYVNDVAVWLSNLELNNTVILTGGVYRFTNNTLFPFSQIYKSTQASKLVFDTAEQWRRGGSAGDISRNERYTLIFNYTATSDVDVLINGVGGNIIEFQSENTLIAKGSLTTDNVIISIKNGFVWLHGTSGIQNVSSFSGGSYPAYAALSYTEPKGSITGNANTGFGTNVLKKLTTGGNNTGFGARALESNTTGGNNIAMGFQSLYRNTTGTDNTAVGVIALEWSTTGSGNTGIGEGALSSNISGSNNTAIGKSALSDMGYGQGNVGIGYYAMGNNSAQDSTVAIENNVAIGYQALRFCRSSNNIGLGYRALGGDTLTGVGNIALGFWSARNTTSGTANVVIGNASVAEASPNLSYTVALGAESARRLTISGNVAIGYQSQNINTSGDNVSVGSKTLLLNVDGTLNTAIGKEALSKNTASENTAVGAYALTNNTTGNTNSAFGKWAGLNNTTGADNTFVGARSGLSVVTGSRNTLIGSQAGNGQTGCNEVTVVGALAGKTLIDGSLPTNINNYTLLGYGTAVSGANQVQLGNSATTPYAYAALQLRSDSRDKADQKELTDVYSDFILGLSPKSWKWDKRDDYVHELFPMPADLSDDATDEEKAEYTQALAERNEKVKEWWSNPTKDGSHTCNRDHLGFIAQEVKELADKLGIDFAGYQDHTVNGGADVKTIAYEAFISPIVLTLQKMNTRLNDIESRLASLESK